MCLHLVLTFWMICIQNLSSDLNKMWVNKERNYGKGRLEEVVEDTGDRDVMVAVALQG